LKWKELKQFVFLYLTDNDGHAIQKKSFENDEQLAMFRQFISEHIHSK